MVLEEAKQKIHITDQETKAVEGYINVWHTTMNALASFDAIKYIEEEKKGWYLPGASVRSTDKEKTPEELGEDILSTIDDFADVYSAMCKYGKGLKAPWMLTRGTSNEEARSLKAGETYDRLISTSTDMEIAKRFTEYGDSALLRIKIDGEMPFLDVDNFIGMDNMSREEEEYVLAPFSKIKQAKYADRDRTYTYYDVELSAPELRPFEAGEKESFRETIKAKFAQIMELGRKYIRLDNESRINWNRFTKATSREDSEYCKSRMEELYQQRQEIKPELDGFSTILKNYIQGLCLEKQREYEEARRIVDEDNQRFIEEERKRRTEELRQGKISEYAIKTTGTIQNLQDIPEILSSNYEQLRRMSSNYAEMAMNLGLPFNSRIDIQAIDMYLKASVSNMSRIKEKIRPDLIGEDSSIEDADSAIKVVSKYQNILSQVLFKTGDLTGAVKSYDEYALFEIKQGIDQKVQDIIRRTKIELLAAKSQDVQARKVSWIGKLTGQDKLKEAELQNLSLQIEFERTRPIMQKESYSIQDSLAEMLAFANSDLGGVQTPEMQDFSSRIIRYFGVNDQVIQRKAYEKLQAKPVVIQGNKKESTSAKIYRLNVESMQISQGIQDNTYKNTRSDGFNQYRAVPNPGIKQFMSILDSVSRITNVEEKGERGQEQGGNQTKRTTLDLWEERR